ncbi:hypothetical protein PoB_003719200 [Plakobranchus ocellatus]|uniref:Uncharacterized protein n=1 Tax=Plakobranchus ocellatus TaxID=259542 RepID=A0AAV4ATP2_9GAST|nr:hypothetical protein PoB_003719200 [Plakobranchus ocellatus]
MADSITIMIRMTGDPSCQNGVAASARPRLGSKTKLSSESHVEEAFYWRIYTASTYHCELGATLHRFQHLTHRFAQQTLL